MIKVRPSVTLLTGPLIGTLAKALVVLLILGWAMGDPAFADERSVLRVCADPNNLPFSNDARDGFENRLAELLARELGGIAIEYTWFPQRRGFARHTLRAKDPASGHYKCDIIMGVPASFELGIATKPYYRSTYALVYVKGRNLDGVKRLDDLAALDPERRDALRIAFFDQTPAALWLARQKMFKQMVALPTLAADPAFYPGKVIEEDLLSGDVDAAIVWGPIAGYFAQRGGSDVEMEVIPFPSDGDIRFDFAISSAVRYGEGDWKDQIQAIYEKNAEEIVTLLTEYGVPLLPIGEMPERQDDDD